jgi:hypothetical protein
MRYKTNQMQLRKSSTSRFILFEAVQSGKFHYEIEIDTDGMKMLSVKVDMFLSTEEMIFSLKSLATVEVLRYKIDSEFNLESNITFSKYFDETDFKPSHLYLEISVQQSLLNSEVCCLTWIQNVGQFIENTFKGNEFLSQIRSGNYEYDFDIVYGYSCLPSGKNVETVSIYHFEKGYYSRLSGFLIDYNSVYKKSFKTIKKQAKYGG